MSFQCFVCTNPAAPAFGTWVPMAGDASGHPQVVLAAGSASIGGVTIVAPLPAGTNTIGAALDAGDAWTDSVGVAGATATSADASGTPLIITDAPTTGQKIVLTDLELSSDTQMSLTLRTTSGHITLGKYFVSAYGTIQITTRGKKKSPTANQTLELVASVAGNIACTATYHSEA